MSTMPSSHIPGSFTAVLLESFSGVEGLTLGERKVPELKDNDVLVKLAAAPINPSDLSFLREGYYSDKALPVVPGIEGSGTVVATGKGIMARLLRGKRVACIRTMEGDGTWAEYMVTRASLALPLHRSVNLEQGSMSIVNPLTAISLLGLARKAGARTVVLTAASSSLGLMINRLAPTKGIRIINVVRREAQEQALRTNGYREVVCTSDPGFSEQLFEICHRYGARLAFDAVGGPVTLQLLDAMPAGSRVTVFGSLAGEPVCVPTDRLVRQDKSVDGFWLTTHMGGKNLFTLLRHWRTSQKMLNKELKSEIRDRYPLAEAARAVANYQEHMSGGKVILNPTLLNP